MTNYTLATCSYRGFKSEMGLPVRISLGVPKHPVPGFRPDVWIKELTPSPSYFRAEPDEFDRRFYGQLDRVGVAGLQRAFETTAKRSRDEHPTLVLLCYEAITPFTGDPEEVVTYEAAQCHRRMFARWWLRETGELIPELTLPMPEFLTPSLF